MLKEKVKSLIKANDGSNKNKIESLIFLLIILIVTIIAINYIWNDKEKKQKTSIINEESDVVRTDTKQENSTLETKLENILSKMNGVGKAEVLLTYTESTEVIPVYNKKEKTSNTDESDAGGGTRKIEEKDSSEEVVYTENGTKGEVATQKTISPKIEGAIIISDGADDSIVRSNIIQAVEAATGIPTHKIQVFKKQV